MRPCRRCRAPIENSAAACPQCGAAQDDGPKAKTDAPPPQHGIVRQLVRDLVAFVLMSPIPGVVVLAIPLLVVGAIGYAVGGTFGALAGFVGASALAFGLMLWADSGG